MIKMIRSLIRFLKMIAKNILAFFYIAFLELKIKNFKDFYVFLQSTHIGDVYATCCLAKQFKKEHENKNFILITTEKLSQICKIFSEIDNIIIYPKRKIDRIVTSQVSYLIGLRKPMTNRLNIAHPATLEKIVGLDNICFFDVLRMQLDIREKNAFEEPDKLHFINKKNIENLLEREGFKKGKTIYIFPDANAMKMIYSFKNLYEKLIYLAFNKGYEIVINNKSKFINDDIPVRFLSLNLIDTIAVAEYFGYVVTARSGISDLLTSANVKLCVLYSSLPSNFLGNNTKYIEYFSLRRYKSRARIKEIELSINSNHNNILEEIFNFFEKEDKI